MRYDLHAHTRASDGVLAPADLVRLAVKLGLQGIAVTDHDTVDGVEEAVLEGERLGVEVVPGVELSVQVNGEDVHVLGYWISHREAELTAALREIFEMRSERAEKMTRELGALGYPIDFSAVLAEADGGSPGRPHVARALMRRGYVSSVEEAFERFIGDDGPAYVPKSKMDAPRGFELLRRFGAVPVLAHPALVDYRALLPDFLARGLEGLEVDHPKHGLSERADLRALCREHDLVPTGGSDFHAPGPPSRALGSHAVSGEIVENLRARRPA